MKKVSFVAGKAFHGNNIFDRNQKTLKVGSFDKYHALHDKFKERGYEIGTDDINKPEDSDIVIYFDMPKKIPNKNDINKSYLLAIESPIIRPENFDSFKIKFFNKVFTWNDDLVDQKKVIKINYSFGLPTEIFKEPNRGKLCCLIVSNKSSKLPNELYSERIKIIRWFEENHIEDFDLFGFGWDSYRFEGPKLIRALNRIPFIPAAIYVLAGLKRLSYRGVVSDKFETMRHYRFAIAYENVKDENGYITEKIFDAFMAGCVPVYWGAKNVLDYIPGDCFVDRRNFKSNEELYSFIKNMADSDYLMYLNNIEKFLNSDEAKEFTSTFFAETIVKNTIGASSL